VFQESRASIVVSTWPKLFAWFWQNCMVHFPKAVRFLS